MSLVNILKELYYDIHAGDEHINEHGDNGGSSNFARGMSAVLDGASELLREPKPWLMPYNRQHASVLRWRVLLFGDQVALHCLRENVDNFYQKKVAA
jgi:hypothetical protein